LLWRHKKKANIEAKEQPKDNNIKQWITVNGVHIPIKKGQNKDDVVDDFISKQKDDEPKKDKPKTDKLKSDNIPSTDTPISDRPSGKNYRVEAQKAILKDRIANEQAFVDKYAPSQSPEWVERSQKAVDNLITKLANVDKLDKESNLPHIPMGKNTHKLTTKGFIHGKTKIDIKPGVFKEPLIELFHNRVKSAWNSLPDDDRDLVDNLVITKKTAKHKYVSGTWDSKTNTLYVHLTDHSHDVESTFYHEIGHAKWYKLEKTNPDKIESFVKKTNEIFSAPTKYANSYRDYELKNKQSETNYRRDMKKRGLEVSSEAEKILEKNRKRARVLYNNETHSELNSYAMGFLNPEKITATKEKMGQLLNAYKELHDL